MMQLSISSRGEVVIPKKVREHLGLVPERKILLEVKGKSVVIRPALSGEDLIRKWEERARRLNIDVSKWVLGDRLYEEEFGRKWAGKLRPARG